MFWAVFFSYPLKKRVFCVFSGWLSCQTSPSCYKVQYVVVINWHAWNNEVWRYGEVEEWNQGSAVKTEFVASGLAGSFIKHSWQCLWVGSQRGIMFLAFHCTSHWLVRAPVQWDLEASVKLWVYKVLMIKSPYILSVRCDAMSLYAVHFPNARTPCMLMHWYSGVNWLVIRIGFFQKPKRFL